MPRRRAADIMEFGRPNEDQRRYVLSSRLAPIGINAGQIEKLVAATGAGRGRDYGFTFSDLTQRLLPAIVLDAYPLRKVEAQRALAIAEGMTATPPFLDRVNG